MADHSTPMSATVKNKWSCKSIPLTRVHGEYRDSCTFTAAATARPRTAQKISLIAVATEVRFRCKASQWGIRDGQEDSKTGFSEFFGFPQSLSIHQFSTLTFHSSTTDPIQPNLRTRAAAATATATTILSTTTIIHIYKTLNISADQQVGPSGTAFRLVLERSPVRSALTGLIFFVVYLSYSREMPRY